MHIHPGIYVILFFVELLSLFVFSQALMKALSKLLYKLTHSFNAAVQIIAILFLPGTIIHELSHVLVAGVTMVHVGEVEFMPEVRQEGVKLGSAQIGETDPFRRALIGVAPVIIGTSLIISSLWYFTSNLANSSHFPIIEFGVLMLVIFQVANTMFSSKKDLEGTLEVLALIASFFLAFYLLGINRPFSVVEGLLYQGLGDLFLKASLFLLVPIGIDAIFFSLSKMLGGRLTQK